MANTYTISDLAKEFDLTTRAIRFYEDMGLLQPERTGAAGRNRVYSARDRTRLRLTLRAKRLGLSLTEAKEIIDLYDSPRDTGVQLRKFLDVLVIILIALLTTLSYDRGVSYYIDAALGLALLSFVSTLVAARYVMRGGPF